MAWLKGLIIDNEKTKGDDFPLEATFPYRNTIRLKGPSGYVDLKLTDDEAVSFMVRNKLGASRAK